MGRGEGEVRLLDAINVDLSELVRYDLGLAAIGAVGGGLLFGLEVDSKGAVLGVAAGFVGVVIGAVVAGVAIQGAFMDEAFLRKVREIGANPLRFLQPLMFTATIGVLASLMLIVAAALPSSTPTWLGALAGALAGHLVVWTLASLLPCLTLLADFTMLKFEASQIDD